MARDRTIVALPGTPLVWAASLASAVAMSAYVLNADLVSDDVGIEVPSVRWSVAEALLILLLLAAIHYVCSAGAVRAVSARPLPIAKTTLVQLAAAATDRLVPSGIGSATVNLRYLRRTGLPTGAATSAVAVLAIVGGATDALYAAGVTVLGPPMGVTGAASQMQTLANQGTQGGRPYRWLVVAAILAIAVAVMSRLSGSILETSIRLAREAVQHTRKLIVRPWRLGTAAAASMLTTVTVSVGFVIAVRSWGQSSSPLPVGALIAIYLVAAAVGSATPLPPLFCATELALVGGLTLAGYSAKSAILSVIVFRVVTYWLPLPVGIWSARRLRSLALL
jgi:uncharacterized membrane protein YbhN (UPF0104 family)